MKNEPPTVTAPLFKLDPGQPFRHDGEGYTRLNIFMPDSEHPRVINIRCGCLSGIRWIPMDAEVELILDETKFGSVDPGVFFWDCVEGEWVKFQKVEPLGNSIVGFYGNAIEQTKFDHYGFADSDPVFVVRK